MGTSTSYRAPLQPRWNAFIAALTGDTPIERVRSELFNAGREWEAAIASPAVAAYASALVALHTSLAERLRQSEVADVAIGGVIAEARHASLEAGFSAASSLAERAFARVILQAVGGVADATAAEIAQRWEQTRGQPDGLVSQYLGEVLGQYARYVTDREAGRLAGQQRGAEASARLSDALAARAHEIGAAAADAAYVATQPLGQSWTAMVTSAFQDGRALPEGDR